MIDQPDKDHQSPNEADSIEPAVEAAKKVLDLSQQTEPSAIDPEKLREQLEERVKTAWDAYAKDGESVEDDDESKSYWSNRGQSSDSDFSVMSGEGGIVIERRAHPPKIKPEVATPLRWTAYCFRSDGKSWADDWRPGNPGGGLPPHQPFPIETGQGLRQQLNSRPINEEELAFLASAPDSIQPVED